MNTRTSAGQTDKTDDKIGYMWQQYHLHKIAAHKHFENGQTAEGNHNWHLAYHCYCKAITSRSQADSLWMQLKGGGAADAGHFQFSLAQVSEYRDKCRHLKQQ